MKKKPGALLVMIFTFVILVSVFVQAQETQNPMGSKEFDDQFIEELAADLAELSTMIEMVVRECMKLGDDECQKWWLDSWLDICRNADKYDLICSLKAK